MHFPITDIIIFCQDEVNSIFLTPFDGGTEHDKIHYNVKLTKEGWYQVIVSTDILNECNGCYSTVICNGMRASAVTHFRIKNNNGQSYQCIYDVANFCKVLYLTTNIWTPKNHYRWPKSFRTEVLTILLCCNRIGRGMQHVVYIIIQKLADKIEEE